MRSILLAGFLLTLCAGCLGTLSTSTAPVYYQLGSEDAAYSCPHRIQESLRLWRFSAATPYDRDDMIIIEPSRKVRFSPRFRWIAPPGTLIADRLQMDLEESGTFRQVAGPAAMLETDLQLSGHIHRFAWEDGGKDGQRAVLNIQISLWREKPERQVVLQKRYELAGERTSSAGPEQFAAAMNRLVARFSIQLQEDLCATASGRSSRSSD